VFRRGGEGMEGGEKEGRNTVNDIKKEKKKERRGWGAKAT